MSCSVGKISNLQLIILFPLNLKVIWAKHYDKKLNNLW